MSKELSRNFYQSDDVILQVYHAKKLDLFESIENQIKRIKKKQKKMIQLF